eukprot:TRINITY_DN38225_c0_g1_i1.p1 TRINITY_DN38225_c0_g1~~TRINITY_DN38225_c0_g1_i1.p1  ORF type:complete len:579 (-),score=104.17 TRINITY_DN38225_c0_g1_i1:131-1867(-)
MPETVQWTIVDGRVVSSPGRKLAQYRMEDVAKHDSASSCWTVVNGLVLDMTNFLDHHPGGRLALLKYAGEDSTELFKEVHIPFTHYADYVEGLAIGTIVDSEAAAQVSTKPLNTFEPIEKFYNTQVDSPFPVERFYGSGLETFRFEWAIRDQMIASSTGNKPVDDKQATRNKSKIAPLNDMRDWLQLGDPAEYAKQMQIRERLLIGEDTKAMVFNVDQDDECVGAQLELLEMMLEWLPHYHPDKFKYDSVNSQIHTLTPGYIRCFNVKDFKQEPLLLCGLLIQEDLYLLAERDVHTAPAQIDRSIHEDENPSGTHHLLVGGLSCFSFDYREKHGLPMSRIHHPYVPGFQLQLQRNINRLFHSFEAGRVWWRHNYAFESDQVYHCITFDKSWAEFVVPSELLSKKSSEELVKTAEDDEANSASSSFNPGAGIDQDTLSSPASFDYIDQKMQMHVEYQTLQRLPKSRQIIFTVRTYYDRLAELKKAPGAAQALSAAMRRKYKGIWRYQNLDRPTSMKAILGYLDDITKNAGLVPGPVMPDPWDRPDTDNLDGTASGNPEHDVQLREMRIWQKLGYERARM